MLGIDHQRADIGTIEPGTDPGVFRRQRGSADSRGRIGRRYTAWVNQTLRQQRYEELKRSERGLVRRYVAKMTGLSRAQVTRLITMYLGGDEVKAQAYRRRCFPRRYSRGGHRVAGEPG